MRRDPDAALTVLPAAAGRTSSRHRWSPRAAVAAATVFVAGIGLFATTDLHGIPSRHAVPQEPIIPPGLPFGLADAAPSGGLPPAGRVADAAGRPPGPVTTGSPAIAGATKPSPEGRLISTYRAIGDGRMDEALESAAALAHDVPSFRLAQLVYGDLLAARIGYAPGLATGALPDVARAAGATTASLSDPSAAGELAQLHEEAVQRLGALQERPPTGAVPAEFVLLPKAVHHAIAVDTSRSRLYLFENGPQGMHLVGDYYVSIGKQGVEKSVEGDQRTPLGVYFVSDRMGGGALEPQFGAGALELDYPNAFDRLHGRTGGGIYVHGVPQDTYSRPPHDSDGCVVIANDDLLALMSTIPVHDTPVVITRRIHWAVRPAPGSDPARLLEAVDQWQSARVAPDLSRLASFYAAGAQPAELAAPPQAPPPAPTLLVHGRRVPNPAAARAARHDPLAFDELSVLDWSDEGEIFVVTFREHVPHVRGDAVVRQYWGRDRDRWKIVAEATVR